MAYTMACCYHTSRDYCYYYILQEIAEPLSDLKQGIAELRQSRTLKCILSTLLAVGNFLNGTQVSRES